MLPEGETLLSTYYEVIKLIVSLGFAYKNIDACPNDCMYIGKRRDMTVLASSVAHLGGKMLRSHKGQSYRTKFKRENVAVKVLNHSFIKARLQ